ncbi:KAT8 regulatory NSL complex subunit 1 [Diorhabda sublineata]|uniref:KAT8 regulatory NSL complex subunit 1 n=1 Tax=Diorhabda sublineata TaxID=1163346 RepID=UPI0024E09AB5|nr:KAT8 regulatory NSL complex subunit 1 [Diorhabda sublineata]
MGLRTASVRHPHVEVMAPALTETVQTQNFDLPPKSCLEPTFQVNSYRKNKFIEQDKQAFLKSGGEYVGKVHLDSNEIKSSVVLNSEKIFNNFHRKSNSASDTNSNNIMNSPSSMGDQDNKMGLQKTGIDISMIHKDKKPSEMEQLLQNFSVSSDLETNVEDIMQVIKSIEGSDKLNNSSNDLNAEGDDIFPITGTDLTNNLSSFEKELLENVDVMTMSMEDQQDELDTVDKHKESQAKEVLSLLQNKHTKLERRLDFIKRRVYKLQSRFLGQHISSEIAGVFENVHHSFKKPKEPLEEPVSVFNKTILPVDKLKPLSYSSAKTLVRKLEMTTVLQASAVARQKNTPKYFGSGSVEIPVPRTSSSGVVTITPWTTNTKNELQKVATQLKTQTSLTQKQVDSEATESSSGGESCDEMQNYNNPHQQYLSVQKRSLWKYLTDRAMIAARWTWLHAQITDLEYRIRQHTDLHKQIRMNKGGIQLGGSSPPHSSPTSQTVNGYLGQLPGSSLSSKTADSPTDDTSNADYECARTRPLVKFKKRKLLQISGLHAVSRKAARPSNMRCRCIPLTNPCALCTGRTDPTYPRDPPDTLSRAEKVMLLDPGFHPVFSLPEDTSQSIHLEAIMKIQEWQQRSTRMKTLKVSSKPERHESKSSEHRTKKLEHRKKYGRLLKNSTMSALSAKIRNKIRGRKPGRPSSLVHHKRHLRTDLSSQSMTNPTDSAMDEEVESIGNNSNQGGTHSADSPNSSPLLHMHSISGYNRRSNSNRFQSYDIDNIVIPYSVAAATRVEKLQYKEILTPKWRIIDPTYETQFETKNNGAMKDTEPDSDVEDLTEDSVIARHDRSEYEEKRRFLSYLKLPPGSGRARHHRRTDSRAESSGGNTPDPMSPHNPDHHDSPMTSPPATPLSVGGVDENQQLPQLPSIAVMRRRTMSQSRFSMGGKEREAKEDSRATTPDIVEVPPYEKRTFPISEETYEKMLKHMPEDHQFQTNIRSQDSADFETREVYNYEDPKLDSPDSESTESAIGEGEEDPNDPEWIDMEKLNRERYKR